MSLFGNAFTDYPKTDKKVDAWCACRPIPNSDRSVWRWDCNGSVIRFADYGDRSSEYGWELDHVVPNALGGASHGGNLRALHWKSNASHGGLLGNLLKDL